jgi:hypothetical protein
MSEHKVDELLRDLAREIDVDPSPVFAAGVRARIAEAPARRPMWIWSSVALAAASVVLAVVIGRPDSPGSEERRDAVAEQPGVVVAERSVNTADAPSHPGTPAPPHPGTVAPSHLRTHPRTLAPTHPRTFEVLVPPDQRILLERLMTALREGRINVEPGGPAIDEDTGELLEPPAIEIPPIVVRALPGTPERIGEGSTHR